MSEVSKNRRTRQRSSVSFKLSSTKKETRQQKKIKMCYKKEKFKSVANANENKKDS